MKVMLLEDDQPLGRSLVQVLTQQGHAPLWLRDIASARRHLAVESFDLLLLDIVLPDGSGLDLLAALRQQGLETAIMMLSARDSVADHVLGLDGGADDYLGKPFAIEELLSRIRALQRRGRTQLTALWSVGDLRIDTARRKVWVADEEISLSTREYDILQALAAQPGKVLTRGDIANATRQIDVHESNALDVHIYNLRKKLGADRIATVRGVGYVLEVS